MNVRTYTRTNLFEKGRDWVVKKVDPKAEETVLKIYPESRQLARMTANYAFEIERSASGARTRISLQTLNGLIPKTHERSTI